MEFKVHTILAKHESYSCDRHMDNRISVNSTYPKFTRCEKCGAVQNTEITGFTPTGSYQHSCVLCHHTSLVNGAGIFKVVSNVPRNMPSQSLSRGQIEGLLNSDASGPCYLENIAYIETMVKTMRYLEVMSTKVKSLFEGSMTNEEFQTDMQDLSCDNPLKPPFAAIREEYELDALHELAFILEDHLWMLPHDLAGFVNFICDEEIPENWNEERTMTLLVNVERIPLVEFIQKHNLFCYERKTILLSELLSVYTEFMTVLENSQRGFD